MYLPAQSFFASRIQGGRQTGGDADSGYDIIDSIIQWFARIFAPLRSWFAELFSKFGSFVTEEYRKSLTFLLDVVHAANGLLKQHPYWSLSISLLISFGPWILLLPFFLIQAVFFVILGLLGFGVAGITGALYQSFCYGGHTPADSLFAVLQSTGTHYNVGTASNWFLLIVRVFAGVMAAYILFGIILVE
ncbi:hypothetical protein L208DRAFT_1379211 [Tricholoma matsutake]|nr:hypothetical protein L208DRAFT_1379211 [Tricholoma matsutake 945]